MKHLAALAPPLLAAVFAAPLIAGQPESRAGHYYLQGVMETGSELLLTPDGHFQWYLSYGALDEYAEGSWDEANGVVTLTAKMPAKAPPPGFQTLRLTEHGADLIPPDGHGAYVRGSDPAEADAKDTAVPKD